MRTLFSVWVIALFMVAGCSKETSELAVYKSGKIDLSASANGTKIVSNLIGGTWMYFYAEKGAFFTN
jgi:hypothetical protein